MSYKPDYGLRLLSDGISRNVNHHFHDFLFASLTVLAHGQYSTMVDIPFNGELYAMSLDFNQQHLEQILSKAPENIATFLQNELPRDSSTPRTIDFDGKVVFGVKARLGELQRAQNESFVPFLRKK